MKDGQSNPGGIWHLKQFASLRRIIADAQLSDDPYERMTDYAASTMKEQWKSNHQSRLENPLKRLLFKTTSPPVVSSLALPPR